MQYFGEGVLGEHPLAHLGHTWGTLGPWHRLFYDGMLPFSAQPSSPRARGFQQRARCFLAHPDLLWLLPVHLSVYTAVSEMRASSLPHSPSAAGSGERWKMPDQLLAPG